MGMFSPKKLAGLPFPDSQPSDEKLRKKLREQDRLDRTGRSTRGVTSLTRGALSQDANPTVNSALLGGGAG